MRIFKSVDSLDFEVNHRDTSNMLKDQGAPAPIPEWVRRAPFTLFILSSI